jgi:RNA polymerase sigma-70 factor (ECF subfamily)
MVSATPGIQAFAPRISSPRVVSRDSQDVGFLAMLDTHRGILYKVANAYCAKREDRGDLIQEIVIELWRAWPRFDGRAAASTWMHQIAVNVAISVYRGQSRRIRDALPIEEFGLDLAAADREMGTQSDDLLALHQLIAQLDPINRGLILLYLEGYSQDEIASMIGLSATNVATRVGRIKQQLTQLGNPSKDTA